MVDVIKIWAHFLHYYQDAGCLFSCRPSSVCHGCKTVLPADEAKRSKLHLNTKKPLKVLQPMGTMLSVTLVMNSPVPGETSVETDEGDQFRRWAEQREDEE